MVDKQAYVFGGELVPRQPVDNSVDVVDLAGSGGTLAASILAHVMRADDGN